MASVNWILTSGSYEVSSKNHLLQIMHKGTLFTDTGTPPTSYWGPSVNYVQTADIDLENDSVNIKPIGVLGDIFSGEYDGASYSISNWSYIDPNFNTASNCENDVGLFGNIEGSSITNVRMTGICILHGFHRNAGFIAGTSTDSDVHDVECFLDDGSEILASTTYIMNVNTKVNIGCIIGLSISDYFLRVNLRGVVSITPPGNDGYPNVGGIAGSLDSGNFYDSSVTALGSYDRLSNSAYFPNGITGSFTGGICGSVLANNRITILRCINSMTGNISGSIASGVLGALNLRNVTGHSINTLVCSMVGNITGSNSTAGVIASANLVNDSTSFHSLINYMSGDITGGNTAGIIRNLSTTREYSVLRSINAMNGTCFNAAETGTINGTVQITINTDYGLIYTNVGSGVFTPVVGLIDSSPVIDIPRVNLVDLDFVYANLPGNSSFSAYTHLSFHTGTIYSPFYVVPTGSISTTYSFSNSVNRTVFIDETAWTVESVFPADVTIFNYAGDTVVFVTPDMTFVSTPINTTVTINSSILVGSSSYKLTSQKTGSDEVTVFNRVPSAENVKRIVNLEPDTEYTIRVYSNGTVLAGTSTFTTPANLIANYDTASLFDGDGVLLLNEVGDTSSGFLSNVLSDILTTGDKVNLGASFERNATYINSGETVNVDNADTIVVPFVESSGPSQQITLGLTDNVTTIPVTYDETSNTVEVDSVVYSPGEYFIIDGFRVRISEI